MTRFTPAVLILLVANALVFVAGALLPGSQDNLIATGALWYPANEHFHAWQLVTYMFLHGGVSHILFNMYALFSFGVALESRWKTSRFLTFWFACGIGAGLVHLGVSVYQYHHYFDQLVAAGVAPDNIDLVLRTGGGHIPVGRGIESTLEKLYRIYAAPALGASGAIYGVLVAFTFMYPNARLALFFLPVPIAAKIFVPIVLAIDLLSGVTGFSIFGGGVAHFAHVGGALVGFVLMLFMRRQTAKPV